MTENNFEEETFTGLENANKVILGIISDSHIPDRANSLHPEILPTFIKAKVDVILHAGDICIPSVITQLESVAPVYAVKGNRDVYFLNNLPMVRIMTFAGHRIALVHGHGRWNRYFFNKIKMFIIGYHLNIFLPTIFNSIPETEVVVFGHIHRPINLWYNKKRLLFNPGSSSSVIVQSISPSIGIIRLEAGKPAVGEIIKLKGVRLKNRRWINI